MAKSNAERQAAWRLRRKQELETLRNEGVRQEGRSIVGLSEDEYGFLMQQLERFRADQRASGIRAERFDAIQSVMKVKAEVDQSKTVQSRTAFGKIKPVNSLNRDLFDRNE